MQKHHNHEDQYIDDDKAFAIGLILSDSVIMLGMLAAVKLGGMNYLSIFGG